MHDIMVVIPLVGDGKLNFPPKKALAIGWEAIKFFDRKLDFPREKSLAVGWEAIKFFGCASCTTSDTCIPIKFIQINRTRRNASMTPTRVHASENVHMHGARWVQLEHSL